MASAPDTYVPATIGHGLRAAARRQPSKVALSDERGRNRTYEDFIRNVNRVANSVGAGLGLSAGQHTALMAANSIEFVEIAIGLGEAGTPPAMINPRSASPEVAYICNDSGAKVLFVDKAFEDVARAADLETVTRIVVIDEELPEVFSRASDAAPASSPDEADIFSIPYTSGTTGKPKGVLLSHRSRVLMMMFAVAGSYGVHNPDCRALAMSPFFNGGGFASVLAPIFFGGTCHIFPRFMAEPMLKTIQERKITNMFMVPTQFHAMFNLGDSVLDRYDRSSLRLINSNAAPLPQATKEKIDAYFGSDVLYDAYGSTEFGSATALRPYDQLRKKSCVGLPQPGCMVKVVGETGEVSPGEVGEIFVRSPWLFSGYWNNPEATAEAVQGGWCTVGDLGRLDEEGYLYLVDRKKNVIITGGQNVFPREVEDVMYHHPAVREVAVVGQPDDYWGERVVAYLSLRTGASVTAEELKQFCSTQLSGYKIPKVFTIREELPKSGAGKILHRVLRDEAAQETRASP